MSDEEDRRLRRVSQKLERRGFSLGLTETSPGKWRADAWSTSLANPASASSATTAFFSSRFRLKTRSPSVKCGVEF